jgi:hypothetical protein
MKLKTFFSVGVIFSLLSSGAAFAQDYESDGEAAIETATAMPVLTAYEYGTDHDNQNNTGTGVPDGDMDTYLFNTSSKHPVEFDIYIPPAQSPAAKGATLRMDVYDIDAPDEVDTVYVNGKLVGALTGSNNTWGINYFNIPFGYLKGGKNRVTVYVDKKHTGYWATTINWGIIKLQNGIVINTGWITPPIQKKPGFINLFATISGTPTKVKAFLGSQFLCELKDSDGDHTWSGQYYVPATWAAGWKPNIYIKAYNASGAVVSMWPGVVITN